MPFNGSGTYALPAGNPVVTGTTISSSTTNTTYSDIATALTNCLTRDGQSTPSANLPMNANKLTGLAAGTSAGDSVRYEQVLLLAGGTMTGAITFAAGQTFVGAGALTPLSTVTASGAATADIETTFSSTYDAYLLIGKNVFGSVDDQLMKCRLKIGGAYITSSDYSYQLEVSKGSDAANTYTSLQGQGESSIVVQKGLSNTADTPRNFTMRIYAPTSTTSFKSINWDSAGTTIYQNNALKGNGVGMVGTAGALTGVRFFMASGNISGTFYLYGIAKL